MMITLTSGGNPIQDFTDYDELFHWIVRRRKQPMSWCFYTYSPKRVVSLYIEGQDSALRQAFEDRLPLIKIRSGGDNPLFIPLTPYVDMDYYKRKWILEYCAFHHLGVMEF